MRLHESVVVLTGASGGIGLELAEQLCAAGARVLAVSRHMGKLAGLMNRYPERLRWQTADLRTPTGREQVVSRAREMGGVNVLINAAGVNRFALLDQLDEYALDELLEPLLRIRSKDASGQLLNTLRAWCTHDGQSQACADALGIHRNSLRYRLERIAELSEVDPLRMEGMLSLYLGLQLLPAD